VQTADYFVEELVHVYENHIKNIHNGLTSYASYLETDYLKDLGLLKRKLEFYLAEVKDGRYNEKPSKPGVVVNNSPINNNKNENINVNQIQIDFELMFAQLREEIANNELLSEEETSEILVKVNEIEEISKSSISRKEKWGKLRGCLNWLGTKGVDIGLKILPAILTILKDTK